ncbi:MFS transporter [Calorimonas adulescens]|uniref:MFS transporter n=1 Tax=Calorimonas adulescens TaxID=2606906 RepID=A0A5D8QDN6_9THEO|nr:MFS transporter [Calorimonas adulescens]TZE82810.1 MFS transporter [Calorimonas adulescens]
MGESVYDNRWYILAAVMFGSMLAPIDGSVVNIAMPTLSNYFKVDMLVVSWVSMAYLLTVSSLVMTFGRLGDIYGYKRIYQYGLLLFTLASLGCSLSSGIYMLIALRVVQALGACMLLAMAPAIITYVFPSNERGKALGFNGMSVAVGLAIGPSLGGFLISTLGWPAIFYINIPIGLIAFLWGRAIIPENFEKKDERFDLVGAGLAFLMLFSLLLYINQGGNIGWLSYDGIILISLFVVSLMFFIYIESKIKEPMLDISLFKIRSFTAGTIGALLNFSGQYIMTFLTPFYLSWRGLSPAEAGMVMSTFPLFMLFMSPLSGTLSDRFGSRLLSALGAFISAAALFLMSTLSAGTSRIYIMVILAMFGIGNGIFQSPNNSSVMGSVPKQRLGIASSFLATMRNSGMVMGVALGSAVFSYMNQYFLSTLNLPGNMLSSLAFIYAIRTSYVTGAMLDIACTIISLLKDKNS